MLSVGADLQFVRNGSQREECFTDSKAGGGVSCPTMFYRIQGATWTLCLVGGNVHAHNPYL